jgi:hypothetical protein
MAAKSISWDIDLSPMVGRTVAVETREGHRRKGKLTDVRMAVIQLQGQIVEYPSEVVLDGDDPIPWQQLIRIEAVSG